MKSTIQKKQRMELKRRLRSNACKKITNINKTLRACKKAEVAKELRRVLIQQSTVATVAAPVIEVQE